MMQTKIKVIDNWGGGLVDADILRPADNQLTEVDGLDPSSGKLRVMKADSRLAINDTFPSSVDGADAFTNVDEYTNDAGELYYIGKRGNTVWFAKPGELVEVPAASSYPQREAAGIFQLNYTGSAFTNTGTIGTLTKVGSPVTPGASGNGNWTTVGTISATPGYFTAGSNSGWWTGKTGFVPFTVSMWLRMPIDSIPVTHTTFKVFQCPYFKIEVHTTADFVSPGVVRPEGSRWGIWCSGMKNADPASSYTEVSGMASNYTGDDLQYGVWYQMIFNFGATNQNIDKCIRQKGLGLSDIALGKTLADLVPQVTLGSTGTFDNLVTATSPVDTYLGNQTGGPQIQIGYFTLLSTYVAIR